MRRRSGLPWWAQGFVAALVLFEALLGLLILVGGAALVTILVRAAW